VAVLHRLVLFLSGRAADQLFATWGELLAVLSDKHPDLSRNRLLTIGTGFPALFACNDKGIQLKKLDQDFLRQYLELADGVVVTKTTSNIAMPHTFSVKIAKTILVSDVPCVYDTGDGGRVHFQFGNTVYSVKKDKGVGGFAQSQKLRAVLCFRNVVNRSELTISIVSCFLFSKNNLNNLLSFAVKITILFLVCYVKGESQKNYLSWSEALPGTVST
jgi:hypothetical protein